ncbi:MAG: glycerol-3-phosphate 1-O-acyltransferase PlsY [Planctomycetota bacterium]|jgi:glycerol-3-phosphate acyltransferase PlsY
MAVWMLCLAGAYLVGSIPFGVLIGRAKGIDIRQHGSRNVGATNVSRVLGRQLGVLCFALDFLKGAGPVVAAGTLQGVFGGEPAELAVSEMWWWLGTGAASVFAHMHSPWLGFRGGKGVATGFGAMVAMYDLLTIPALAALVVWYATVRVSRYVSLASILATLSLPVLYMLWLIPNDVGNRALADIAAELNHASPPLLVTALLAVLVIYKHRLNIVRLRRGEEPKAGARSKPAGKAHQPD